MSAYNDILIPVYLISIRNSDGLPDIGEPFQGKPEFELNIIEADMNNYWQAMQQCVRSGIDKAEDVLVICNQSHRFTENYARDFFIGNILEAHEQGCDILAGGMGGFNQAVPITKNRYWIDRFWYCHFMVVFRKFYDKLLSKAYKNNKPIDDAISELTMHKMALYPFISTQRDFSDGISDDRTLEIYEKMSGCFTAADKKLSVYARIQQQYLSNGT